MKTEEILDKLVTIQVKEKLTRKQMTKAISTECNKKYIMKWINKWKKDYEKQDYEFMVRENIYKSVVKILNTEFQK